MNRPLPAAAELRAAVSSVKKNGLLQCIGGKLSLSVAAFGRMSLSGVSVGVGFEPLSCCLAAMSLSRGGRAAT